MRNIFLTFGLLVSFLVNLQRISAFQQPSLSPISIRSRTPPARSRAILTSGFINQKIMFATTSTSTSASLVDYTGAAISYFDSIRTPSALIAGSALAALFSLASEARKGGENQRLQSKLENNVLLSYHILALLSFLLSLNVVVTATASSNLLILGEVNGKATSLYNFLMREMEYDFVLTCWSFFAGMFSFLGCIVSRALIEFDLLKKERFRSALMVVVSISTLFFQLLSFTNQRLVSHTNMLTMTIDVGRLFLKDALLKRNFTAMASLITSAMSVITAGELFRRSQQVSKPDKQ